MKEINLTQGKVAFVDDEDFEFLNQWKWYAKKGSQDIFYAERRQRTEIGKIVAIKIHREILRKHNLLDESKFVDHIDHDGLNNQKCNLRNCTSSQNQQNKRSRISGSSKYKGVHFSVERTKSSSGKILEYPYWHAEISSGYRLRTKRIGRYKTETEAALAYNKKALELFGEFANLNKVYCNPCVITPNNLIQHFKQSTQ